MKLNTLFFIAFISFMSIQLSAQMDEKMLIVKKTHEHLDGHHSCGFHGEEILVEKGHSFATNQEAIQVVNDIMNAVGLRANFKIQGAKVPNAAAVVMGETRYVLYNPKFIKNINKGTKTDWAAISIMAHEIGHHLNGHTLTKAGSRPATELEADEFSGFVLHRLGAPLKDAQAAMNLLANPYGSLTHPAKDRRLAAIEKGWRRAQGGYSGEMPDGTKEDAPVVVTKPKKEKEKPQKETAEEEGEWTDPEIEPVPKPKKKPPYIKPSVHPTYAQWQVVLEKNPGSLYYITTGNKFVVIKGKKIFPMGQIKRTGNRNYPYVIDMEKSPDLFIAAESKFIYTKTGQKIGFLEKI